MEMSEALEELNKQLFYYDWYAKKVAKNPILHNSIVAYVHRMGLDVYKAVPDKIGDWQVRIHFIGSYNATADSFKVPERKSEFQRIVAEIEKDGPLPTGLLAAGYVASAPNSDLELVGVTETDVSEELWQLSKLCGWEALEDIFFEVHDGPNAVTDRSKDFPKVRAKLEELYELVGFDVLADEIC